MTLTCLFAGVHSSDELESPGLRVGLIFLFFLLILSLSLSRFDVSSAFFNCSRASLYVAERKVGFTCLKIPVITVTLKTSNDTSHVEIDLTLIDSFFTAFKILPEAKSLG